MLELKVGNRRRRWIIGNGNYKIMAKRCTEDLSFRAERVCNRVTFSNIGNSKTVEPFSSYRSSRVYREPSLQNPAFKKS